MKSLGWKQIALTLAAFLFIISVLLAIGVVPLDAGRELILGSLGTKSSLSYTLREMTPLLIAGLAVFIALRAGLFNIGAEGQLLIGGLAAVWVALNVTGWFGIVLAVVVGAVAGAVWALPAGLIKAYRGGHEVITTIMLNNIAGFFALGIVAGPLKSPDKDGPVSDEIAESVRFPNAYENLPFELNWALIVAIVMAIVLAAWLKKSVSGYELDATGSNPKAAEIAGVAVKRVTVRAMAFSGALAGVAGAIQVLAFEHEFKSGLSSGIGFDALGVALLAGNTPWGVIPSAFLFGVLGQGTTSIQTLGVPKGISGILLGLLIIVFAAYRFRKVKTHD